MASLLYTPTANTVFGLLACTSTTVSQLAYAWLDRDSDSGAAVSGREGLVSVILIVLANNPSIVCYQGSHMPAGVVAWIALALVTVGYPLWTLLWSRARIVSLVRAAVARELRLRPAGSSAAVKSAASSKAISETVWQRLRDLDSAAIRAALLARPGVAWPLLICCGRERMMRRLGLGSATAFAGGKRLADPERP
jgi:uncharacterized membrane protein